MITTHLLSTAAFSELAGGGGDRAIVRQLGEAQHSKHLMLLHVIATAAGAADPAAAAPAAFRAGLRLLARAQAADPGAAAMLLALPHVGSWAHDSLACLDTGQQPDFGYLATVAAAAAIRLGLPFELDVPVRNGGVLLPGLGVLRVGAAGAGDHGAGGDGTGSQEYWVTLDSDGTQLRAGGPGAVPCAVLVPDDGTGAAVPGWQGTPLVRVEADGQTWEVLLEVADPHLDRYALPMAPALSQAELAVWRDRIQAAWELLVRRHAWVAGPVAAGVRVIVPLVPRSDLDSATSPAAFGAIATSLPPTTVSLAETLVHEFQHGKLCGLMDLVPLVGPGGEPGYAPWRDDPRPPAGILQGVYAFSGVVRFWEAQRHAETAPDDILRAHVLYERWRLAIVAVTSALAGHAALTEAGGRFLAVLGEQARHRAPVPGEASEIAREIALDNWLNWQLANTAADAERAARLAAAFRCGDPPGDRPDSGSRVQAAVLTVDSVARSRLLNLRYQGPRQFSDLRAAGFPGLPAADALLLSGETAAAAAAYRGWLSARADPAAWIGLTLAAHRLSPGSPATAALGRRLPLIAAVHACLVGQGGAADPLDVAAWLG